MVRLQPSLTITEHNTPSVSGSTADIGTIGVHARILGTVAVRLPLKGNVETQHVTLTVLFASRIIMLFGHS